MGSAFTLASRTVSGPDQLAVYIDAAAMKSRTTAGAEAAGVEYATNDVNIDYYNFDSAAEEGVQFKFTLPADYNGGVVNAKFHWSNTAGLATETVTWGIALRTIIDNDLIDQAFAASVDTSDTWIAQNDWHVSAASADITIANTPVAGATVLGEVTRVISDDLTGDAQLMGVEITYAALAATDTYTQVSIPAGAFGTYTTSGAEAGTTVYGSNELDHFAFSSAAEEGIYLQFELPSTYKDGSVIRWGVNWDAVATASGTAVWGLSGGAFANDLALSTAFGTQRTVTDTLIAVGDRHRSPNDTTGITLAGTPVAGDWVTLKLVNDLTGTIAVDVLFLGLELQFEKAGVADTVFA
jgi:hypothetical protein